MPRSSIDSPHCIACGGIVRRAHRTEQDAREGASSRLRRFACLDAACGWQGLLPRASASARDGHRAVRSARVGAGRPQARRSLWLLIAGLLGLLAMAVAGLVTMGLRPERPAAAPAFSNTAPLSPAPALQPRR